METGSSTPERGNGAKVPCASVDEGETEPSAAGDAGAGVSAALSESGNEAGAVSGSEVCAFGWEPNIADGSREIVASAGIAAAGTTAPEQPASRIVKVNSRVLKSLRAMRKVGFMGLSPHRPMQKIQSHIPL